MSTARTTGRHRLRVNAYDRVSSWLVALLIIVATTVAGLMIVYFTRQLIVEQMARPITPVEAASRPAEAAMGLKHDLEPPGIEEVTDLLEPQLQDTLRSVTNAVSSKTALLASEDIDEAGEVGHGRGEGDIRQAGIGHGDQGPREPQREIRFEPKNVRHYAQYLDYFGIELGVLGADNKIYYAYNLSREKPDVRTGDPADEKRLYMNPTHGNFAALDRRLAKRAGIADKGRIILQFYPPETQAILFDLERKHGGRKPEFIRLTVFRVTPQGERFVFSVEEQKYRGG